MGRDITADEVYKKMPWIRKPKSKAESKINIPGHQDSDWFYPPVKQEDEWAQQQYDERRANSVLDYAKALESAQSEVHQAHLLHGQLYSNRELTNFDWGTHAFVRASLKPVNRVNENIIKSTIDTLYSRVAKQRPKATPISRGGSFSTRKKVRRLDKFLWGETLRTKLYQTISSVVRTAAVYGFGGKRYFMEYDADEDRSELCIRSVFPDEIIVDESEVTATGDFSYLYWRRVLPVETAAAEYKCSVDELLRVSAGQQGGYGERSVGAGFVLVVEAWRKRQGKSPGRCVVAAGNYLIKDEPWDECWVPFDFFHYEPGDRSFYRPSMTETCLPFQIRYNELSSTIRESENAAKTWVLVPFSANTNINQFANRQNTIIQHTPGMPPTFATVPLADIGLYNERRRIEEQCLTHHGLTSYAQGNLPGATRLDSSRALNEYNAIQEDRLFDINQRLENYYLETFEMIIRMYRKYAKNSVTKWSGGSRARTELIKWDDIDLDDLAYTMQLGISNAFSMGPAAAKEELMNRLMNGIITPQEYKEAIASPDFETLDNLATATSQCIDKICGDAEDGIISPIYEEMDLTELAKRLVLNMNLLAQYDDVPDDVYKAHRFLLEDIKAKIEASIPEPEPQPDPSMMVPPGPEMQGIGGLPPPVGVPPIPAPGQMGAGGPMTAEVASLPPLDMSSMLGAIE